MTNPQPTAEEPMGKLSVLMKEKMRKQKAVGHDAGSVVSHETMEGWIQKAKKLESRLQAIAEEVEKRIEELEENMDKYSMEDDEFYILDSRVKEASIALSIINKYLDDE